MAGFDRGEAPWTTSAGEPIGAGDVGDMVVLGQSDQVIPAVISAAAIATAVVKRAMLRRRGSPTGTVPAGNSATVSGRKAKTRTDRTMFFTLCSPRSSNAYGSLSRIWSLTTRDMQIPPGSANASSRAATLTP